MTSRFGSLGKWSFVLVGLVIALLIARKTVFRHQQTDSGISRPNFQAPKDENVGSPTSDPEEINTLAQVLELARQLKLNMEREVADYTATVVKRERIKGKLGNEDFMQVKIRHELPEENPPVPFSVYLMYVPPSASAGREVIWIQGRNDGKLMTHQFGLRLSLPTDGLLAMMGNKYPITDIGMLNLAEKLIEKGERDLDKPNCKVELFENQKVADRECRLIQVTHPQPLAGLDYHVAQIYIDNENRLPIRYAAYIWPEKEGDPPLLEEEYTYVDLHVNTGLTDTDFDPSHPEYKFPK